MKFFMFEHFLAVSYNRIIITYNEGICNLHNRILFNFELNPRKQYTNQSALN